jgi:hypothetical protein
MYLLLFQVAHFINLVAAAVAVLQVALAGLQLVVLVVI